MQRQTLKVLIPMFAGVSLLLAGIKSDYDKQTDFGKFKTYSWISAKGSNDLWSERIMQDVDAQLTARGWSKVESGGDATVSAFGRTRNEQTLNTFYDRMGGGWRWGGGFGESWTQVESTPVGSLTVDIFDSSSKKLVWRSTATETLSSKPDKNEKKLEHTVADMFKKFPTSRG